MGGDSRRYLSGRCQSAFSVGTTTRTVGYQPLYIRVWRDVLVWRGSDLVAGAQICIDASPCWSGGYLPYGPLIAPRRLANDVSNARPGVTTRTSKRAAGK